MAEKITLRSLFDSKKSELEQQLEGLSLPKDNLKIQRIISEYLATLFDSEGDFRQNLTQTEDYLLQASLSLLTAQQEMCSAFISQDLKINIRQINKEGATNSPLAQAKPDSNSDGINGKANDTHKRIQDYLNVNVSAPHAAIGSTAGAIVGKLVLGGWGAVFGAIAGTAVLVYLAGRNTTTTNVQPQVSKKTIVAETKAEIANEPINVQKFIGIVGGICDSLDNLIATFRAQVNRVIDKYESMEKPSIEKQYSFLLESIQTLIGYKRTHTSDDEKYLKKIQSRIEDLAECLENYNLTTEDYNGDNEHLFELISSPETKEVKMAYPAIVKEGVAVLKGKVFIPANNQ